MLHRSRTIVMAVGVLALALVPPAAAALNQPFYIDLFRRMMIFALAALSLDLVLGYGCMVSFGHAAYLGIGAYAVGILAFYGVDNGFLQWSAAIAASAVAALVIGAISIRTSGVSFIMITLAFAQMLYYLGISLETYGGDNGMPLRTRSQFAGLIDLRNPYAFYYLVLALLVLFLVLGHRLVNARFGMVIRAAKSNEPRARAIGFSPFRYKLVAFVLAGGACGLAGALLANQTEYLTPEFMHWTRSGEIMFMVILGGMGTLVGPVIGAVVLLLLEDVLSALTAHWQIILGHSSSWSCSSPSAACSAFCSARPRAMAETLLAVRGLSKRFGGLLASDRINLDVVRGETHAIIGPNGAGKTTLIGQLAGDLRPDAGAIRFVGRDVTGFDAPLRSRLGLARSFQITSIFRDFSALDNVALAVQAHRGGNFRFWRSARDERALREPA